MKEYQWPICVNTSGGSRPLQLKLESKTQSSLNVLKYNHIKLLLSKISDSLDKLLDSFDENEIKELYEKIEMVPEKGDQFLTFLESIFTFKEETSRVTNVLENLEKLCKNEYKTTHLEKIKKDWNSITQIFTEPKFESYLPLAKVDKKLLEPFLTKLEKDNTISGEDSNEFKKALSSIRPIRLQNFVKIHQVGQGSYGDVWLAEDIVNKTPVALKKLKLNEEREGFPKNSIREILLLNSLKHKNIVNLLGMSYSRSSQLPLSNNEVDKTKYKNNKDDKDNKDSSDDKEMELNKDNKSNENKKEEDKKDQRGKDSDRDKEKPKENVWMVFEYLPFDLSGYLEALRDKSYNQDNTEDLDGIDNLDKINRNNKDKDNRNKLGKIDKMNKWDKMTRPHVWLSMGEIKTIMLQLLRAVSYCHRNNVLHRDLKTANLLMDREGVIKLADFGLARLLPLGRGVLTNRVVTLWYRPPELLLGSERYDFGVDMWSVGCIMSELVSGAHVFAADKEFLILRLICEHIGLPDETDIKYLKTLPLWNDTNANPLHPDKISGLVTRNREFEKIFSERNMLGKDGWDLLKRLFSWSPSRRITAKEALKHQWFKNNPLPTPLRERKGIKAAHSFMAKNQRKRETINKRMKRGREHVKYANTGEIRKALARFEPH